MAPLTRCLFASYSLPLRGASGVGDLNPPVLHAAFIVVVIGDGPRLAVAFRGHPPRCDAMLRQPYHDRVGARFRKLLVVIIPTHVVRVSLDNVGGDDYNQKLSEARANSVMIWLTQHGVAAGRMTAKGYGKTRPVADNNNDEGRMKNRRVEIADPRCTPQGK